MTHLNKDNCPYTFINTIIKIVIIDTSAALLMLWWLVK